MKINFSSLKVYVNTEIQKLHNVFSPILHSHGNITSNGMIGDSNNNANKNVVTDENGQITIEEKTEGLDSFNYGYIDENLQCHLIKVEEINILSADSQLSPSEDFNLSGEIITDDETNNSIAVKIYLNNDYLETVYTYGYDKGFDFSIEDSELVSGENIIKMQCGNIVLEHTCLLSQDTLTLTSDKDILSYADEDSCTLTATLTNNNMGVSGETITFKNRYDEVLDTVQTDSNGEATYEYISQGDGDIIIIAEYQSLQEAYGIEDCYLVDENEYHATGRNYTRILPDFSFPNTDWEISSNFKETHNGGQFGVGDITSPTTQKDYASSVKQGNNYYLSGLDGVTDSSQELWSRSTTYMSNIYYPVKIRHENGTLYYYFNETLMDTHVSNEFNNVSNLGLFLRGYYNETNTYVKDIKIKPIFRPKVDKQEEIPEIPDGSEL